jgi:hypothetical protein
VENAADAQAWKTLQEATENVMARLTTLRQEAKDAQLDNLDTFIGASVAKLRNFSDQSTHLQEQREAIDTGVSDVSRMWLAIDEKITLYTEDVAKATSEIMLYQELLRVDAIEPPVEVINVPVEDTATDLQLQQRAFAVRVQLEAADVGKAAYEKEGAVKTVQTIQNAIKTYLETEIPATVMPDKALWTEVIDGQTKKILASTLASIAETQKTVLTSIAAAIDQSTTQTELNAVAEQLAGVKSIADALELADVQNQLPAFEEKIQIHQKAITEVEQQKEYSEILKQLQEDWSQKSAGAVVADTLANLGNLTRIVVTQNLMPAVASILSQTDKQKADNLKVKNVKEAIKNIPVVVATAPTAEQIQNAQKVLGNLAAKYEETKMCPIGFRPFQ